MGEGMNIEAWLAWEDDSLDEMLYHLERMKRKVEQIKGDLVEVRKQCRMSVPQSVPNADTDGLRGSPMGSGFGGI